MAIASRNRIASIRLIAAIVVLLTTVRCSLATDLPREETEGIPIHGLAVSRYFEDGARSLPATHPGFSVDFALNYGGRLFWDTGYLLTAPGRWQSDEWRAFAIVAGGTAALFGADRPIDIESRRRHPRSSSEKHVERGIQNLGSLAGIGGVVAGSELFGFVWGNDEFKSLGMDALEAAVVSDLLTEMLKKMAGRERPYRADGPFEFKPFSGNASFPSGHSAIAFSLAATVSEHFDNDLWVTIPTYALATGVALARTRANAHFASDVFLGAAIGISTARTLVDLEFDRRRISLTAGPGWHAALGPATVAGRPGFAFSFVF